MPAVSEKIRDYLVAEFGVAQSITTEELLFSSGLLDSFSMVDLLSFVEDLAGRRIRVVDVNLDNLDSIDRIVALVERTVND